jgi:hypothetical protein
LAETLPLLLLVLNLKLETMKLTELERETLKLAFQAGRDYERTVGQHICDFAPDFDEWLDEYLKPKEVVEKTVPITYGMIKNSCGWSRYCDVAGGNHYAVKEYGIGDREIFDVKISHAKELGLI